MNVRVFLSSSQALLGHNRQWFMSGWHEKWVQKQPEKYNFLFAFLKHFLSTLLMYTGLENNIIGIL